MLDISLKEFLRTGSFGPIVGPMLRGEVRAELGPPDSFGCGPEKETGLWHVAPDGTTTYRPPARTPYPDHAAIWKYGSFEFHFVGRGAAGRLSLIYSGHFARLHGGKRVHLLPWKLRGGVRRRMIQEELEALGIGYRVQRYTPEPTHMQLLTDGGVEVLFGEVPCGGEMGLCIISRAWREARWCQVA